MDTNEFKKQYEVKKKPQVYSDMEERIEQGKKEEERIIKLTEKQEQINKIVDLINRAYENRELTEEERKEFLSIDEDAIPNTMLKKLYQLARAYVEGKTVDFEKLTKIGPSVDVTPKDLREKMRRQLKLIEKQSKEGKEDGR